LNGINGKTYQQWITLFDDQGDDEYDGQMGLQDDEDPRILVEFCVTPVTTTTSTLSASLASNPATTSKNTGPSYMNPIKNSKGTKR
jgi:hypothetical protein